MTRTCRTPFVARRLVVILCLAAALTAGTRAAPQPPPGAPQTPPQNLQVLPKDWARADVLVVMRGFTQALGVQCGHCHVEDASGRNDFPADTKPAKRAARAMLRMTAQINETLAADLGKPVSAVAQVECATCHRGAAIPALPPIPAAAR